MSTICWPDKYLYQQTMTQHWMAKQWRSWALLLSLYGVHLCWLWSFILCWPDVVIGCDGVEMAQYPSSRYLYVPLLSVTDVQTSSLVSCHLTHGSKNTIDWPNIHMSSHVSAWCLTFDDVQNWDTIGCASSFQRLNKVDLYLAKVFPREMGM